MGFLPGHESAAIRRSGRRDAQDRETATRTSRPQIPGVGSAAHLPAKDRAIPKSHKSMFSCSFLSTSLGKSCVSLLHNRVVKKSAWPSPDHAAWLRTCVPSRRMSRSLAGDPPDAPIPGLALQPGGGGRARDPQGDGLAAGAVRLPRALLQVGDQDSTRLLAGQAQRDGPAGAATGAAKQHDPITLRPVESAADHRSRVDALDRKRSAAVPIGHLHHVQEEILR